MKHKENIPTILERFKAPTPVFFIRLRSLGLVLTAAGGALLATPVLLPDDLIKVAGYIIVAGGVITAVSQVTMTNE